MLKSARVNASDPEPDFNQIHDAYRRRIYLYLCRMVGEGEAEDLTQEVFARASRALKTFRGESQLSTWLYRIATNAALDRLRRRSRTEEAMPLDAAGQPEDADFRTGEVRSLDEQVIRREMNDCIRDVISTLPEPYRTVIVLSELEGFRGEEMAEILGLSLEAAKIRLHRARAKLREALSERCTLYRNEQNERACDLKEGFVKIETRPRSGSRR